jgi:predicted porin
MGRKHLSSIGRVAATAGVLLAFNALIPVHAQSSISLYGVVDGGVISARSGAPGGKTQTAVVSGLNSASRWGLRGTEDLGDGFSAFFVLEAGFDLDSGSSKPYAGNPSTATPTAPNGSSSTGFNRRAVVGINSRWGSLSLGRDYTPTFHALNSSDVFVLGLFGNLQAATNLTGTSERWARASNAAFYLSPDLSGLKIRAMYSLGSEGGTGSGNLPRDANRMIAVGAEYKVGNLQILSSYQELTYPLVGGSPLAFTGGTARRKDATLGARYRIGTVELGAGYFKVGSPVNGSDAWLGATWDIGFGALRAQVQRLSQDNPAGGQDRRGYVLGLGYVYTLSKRSSLYATYGHVSNNDKASFTLYSNDVAVTAGAMGARPSAIGLGMRHAF